MTTATARANAAVKARKPRVPRTSERDIQLAVQQQEARVAEDVRPVVSKDDDSGEDVVHAPLKGKLFRVDLDTGLMPLMEWAAANDSAVPQNGPQLAALFFLLQDVVHPDDWDDFRAHAKATKSKGPDFLKFQEAAAEGIAAVPTEQPEDSSAGS